MSVINKSTPKVSIGMPVYNGERYIKEALDSLLAQTFRDFELIISDNGSTDATDAICKEYAIHDARIRYVRQTLNQGAATNFQFVLDEAVGEYFMWAAYDDIWSDDFLMHAIELLHDETISFVMPSFELRSIALQIAKKFDMKIFNFIESEDVKYRVLKFISLHYLSHSANMVYSFFRRKFLKAALSIQDIGNDGALAVVLLSLGRGAISNSLFSKRYPTVWPGMLPSIFGIIKGRMYQRDILWITNKAIQKARNRMLFLFPQFEYEISFIYNHYKPYGYDKDYNICAIEGFFEKELAKNISKVSIGMPVYNGERYIKEALDSLLAQTFGNFELIISDNASTDDTEIICKEYAANDSRIRYVRQAVNKGASNNFQFVLDEAVGQYFMWAASDDRWSINWIETLVYELSADLHLVSFGEVVTIDEHSKKIEHPANHRIFNFYGNRLYRRVKYFFELESFGKANVIYGLFRLKNIKDLKFGAFEFDYNINYSILSSMHIKSTQDAILYKRVHDNNDGGINRDKKSFIQKSIHFLLSPWEERKMFLIAYLTYSNWLEKLILIMLYLPKIVLIYFYGIKKLILTIMKK